MVSNLAAAYAETGRSVLVIDCDMARPRQHEILAIPNESGLGALLAQTDSLDARSVSLAICGAQIPGVKVIPFGDPEGGASANLLHSKRFPELIDLVRETFDVVLIDHASHALYGRFEDRGISGRRRRAGNPRAQNHARGCCQSGAAACRRRCPPFWAWPSMTGTRSLTVTTHLVRFTPATMPRARSLNIRSR